MTVVGTGTRGTKIVRTSYPVVSGNEFGTSKTHDRIFFLIPESKSLISSKDKVGI